MKNDKINYWKLLSEMGIRYGIEVVLSSEIKANGSGFDRVLEYNGANYKTAADIYQAVSRK